MKLSVFDKEKENKRIEVKKVKIIGLTLGLLALMFLIIAIYQSFAIYKLRSEGIIINSSVTPFKSSDVSISLWIDENKQAAGSNFPTDKYFSRVECTNGETGTWNDEEKILELQLKKQTECSIYFRTTNMLREAIIYDNGGEETIVVRGVPSYATSAVSKEVYSKLLEFDSNGTPAADRKILAKDGVKWITYGATNNYSVTNGLYKTRTNIAGWSENKYGSFSGTDDNDGPSYYYRGAISNNFVKFGKNASGEDLYWRIIRINGDRSIRLIYNGTNIIEYGIDTQIEKESFNTLTADNAYVGYKYGSVGQSAYNTTHANTIDSTIKLNLETWYTENIEYTAMADKMSDSTFCSDRNIMAGVGYGQTDTWYGSFYRLWQNKKPSLQCKNNTIAENITETHDQFTVTNGKLNHRIGLITADELALAGAAIETVNGDYWLYTSHTYWTMSPYSWRTDLTETLKNQAICFVVGSSGELNGNVVLTSNGVRPIINLMPGITITSGNGTANNPYIIE